MIILQDKGYDIRMFNSGQKLFESIDELPDLFILDGLLGGMDGLKMCLQLKTDTRTSHIPVIMLSALNNIKEMAAAHCADGAIEKPFEIDDLLLTIDKFI